MPDVASPHSWARELAEKIRSHEAATIDETAEQRTSDLASLVRKSLAGIPPSLRNAYLDELDTHFPAAASPGAPAASPARAAAESPLAVLTQLLPELSTADRAELLRQLLNRAFQDSHSGGRLARLLLEVPRKANPPSAGAALDPDRLFRLLETFSEALLALQRLTIELWRDAAARKLNGAPALASDADFRALLARCLKGDPEAPPSMVEQEIERQRRAIAAAMSLLGPFAEDYAGAVLKRMAPETISRQTGEESFSMFGSREAGYWKHYCRTWESLGHEQCESIFMECLARHLRVLNR